MANFSGSWTAPPPANSRRKRYLRQRIKEENSFVGLCFLCDLCGERFRGGETLLAPVANLFQSLAAGMLEQPHAMARVLELVDIRPHLGFPAFIVRR